MALLRGRKWVNRERERIYREREEAIGQQMKRLERESSNHVSPILRL